MKLNPEQLRAKARRTLPHFAFDYIDGGAEGEVTLNHNRAIFQQWRFLPSVLRDSSQRNIGVALGRTQLAAPLLVAPTGYNGMLRNQSDLMLARAAAQAGIGHIQSTVSTASIEDIQATGHQERWFQLYVLKDKQVTENLISRAKDAGCTALVVSVDAVHFGHRERDKQHYRRPMKLSFPALCDVAMKPGWVLRTLVPHGMPGFGNLKPYLPAEQQQGAGGATYFAQQMDQTLSWETLAWIRSLWDGALYVKGIMTVDDALMAQKIGAQGIVLSNHGGRQLDGTASPMSVLASVRAAVGDEFIILIDSGFRRGTDVVKALILGANAVLIGRPLLYAVAAGGEALTTEVINALVQEVDRTLAQLGCNTLADLRPEMLQIR